MDAVLSIGNCNSWFANHKKVTAIPHPKVIQHYNNGMGDVDLFDQFRAKYRVSFRKLVLSNLSIPAQCNSDEQLAVL